MTRRNAAKIIAGTAAGMAVGAPSSPGATTALLERVIPSSGEKLPVIGLGTWQVFDVGQSTSERKPLEEVLAAFVRLGGRLVDSSPMYGRAEETVGEIAAQLRLRDHLFLASKVWTRGQRPGEESLRRSAARMQTKAIDLMQVHNLLDLETQLQTLRRWKEEGLIRYLGVTHYSATAFPDVQRVLARETLDFLQINYSIVEPEAEQVLLPLAQDRKVAVIVNRPFGGGDLFRHVRGRPLPPFAAEIGCASWAQLFLKWAVAHPAVTCAIPATNNLDHLQDNMAAGLGSMPDAAMRGRIRALLSSR